MTEHVKDPIALDPQENGKAFPPGPSANVGNICRECPLELSLPSPGIFMARRRLPYRDSSY